MKWTCTLEVRTPTRAIYRSIYQTGHYSLHCTYKSGIKVNFSVDCVWVRPSILWWMPENHHFPIFWHWSDAYSQRTNALVSPSWGLKWIYYVLLKFRNFSRLGVDVLVCTPFDFGDLNILCFRIVIMLIYKTGGTWRLGVTLSNTSPDRTTSSILAVVAFQMQDSSQNILYTQCRDEFFMYLP